LYLQARIVIYSSNTIQNRFKATSLVPFNLNKVLSQLHIQLQTPSPPRLTLEATARWVPETLHNTAELNLQSKAIQALIRYRTTSPPNPTIQAVNQLIKDCQITIQSATLLTAENRKLQAVNKKVKKKREKKKSYVSKGKVLNTSEV